MSADLADLPSDPADEGDDEHALVRSAARLLRTAEQLEAAADHWRQGRMR
jgi:hypothetical protein